MKTIRVAAALRHLLWGIVLGSSVAGFQAATAAVQMKQARVTFVVNDVKLVLPQVAPRPAAVNDNVRGGVALRTGTDSRSELTFPDLTITRLGANTIFSFNQEARTLDLSSGAILVQVPKHSSGVKIQTAGATAAITGTTVMMEYHPGGFIKAISIEGTFRMYLKSRVGESVLVHAGEMLIVKPNAKRLPDPVHVDLEQLLKTSLLITGFGPLPSLDLMAQAVQAQIAEEASGQLIQTNLVIFGSGTLVSLLDPTNINTVSQAAAARPAPTPTPNPNEFGPPTVITSPVPYLITSGTIITTDPAITTNGVTDFGKIYRGQTDDGAFTLWAFGSTSAFDTALGIDDVFFADPNHLPIAVFEFQSLSLTGNPTIDLSNGGVTKLALIGVDGITSGPPGGVLTFTGLDLLLLATVNGSINLTSDVSFQNLGELAMYARGAGSNLILNSPISNIGILELAAEGSIHLTNPGTMSVGEFDATAGNNLTLQIGGSLLLNGSVVLQTLVLPGTTVANGANLTLNITGDYMNSSTTGSSYLSVINEGAHIGTGGNILVDVGGNLTTAGDFDLTIQNTTGQIDNGGNVTLTVGGSLATQALTLFVENWDGTANPAGNIGTGGNISVTTGGDLTAGSIDALIDNRNGGTIDSSANLTFNIGGALTTTGAASFGISNSNVGSGGGMIGSDAMINVSAASISAGGALFANIFNLAGGSIGGSADINFNLTGDLTTQLFSTFQVVNNGGTIGGSADLNFNLTGDLTASAGAGFFIDNLNGTIASDDMISVSAANVSTGGLLFADIDNSSGGNIGSNATINVAAGSISAGGDFDAEIANFLFGTIGGNATINLSATSLSVDGGVGLLVRISNQGFGNIGGSAIVNFDLSGAIDTQGDADFQILNENDGSHAGTIGSDAMINVSAANISTGGTLNAAIDNSSGGTIGGIANLSFNLSGDLATQVDTVFTINNTNGGMIGADTAVNVSAASISAGGALFANIFNHAGGSIVGSAAVSFTLTGDLTTSGDANFLIDNSSSGTIGGNTAINVNAANITANSLLAQINNTSGTIGGNANINFNLTGDLQTVGDASFSILNGGGTIGGDSSINVNAASISIGGSLSSTTDVTADAASGGDSTFTTGGSFSASGVNAETTVESGVTLTDGANITFDIGTGLTVNGGSLSLTINDSNGGTIGTGGNITLNTGANLTVNGGGALTLDVLNNDGGHIGTGGNISVTTGGNLTTGSIDALIDNRNGGTIDSSANLTFNIGGDLTTTGDASFGISNSNDGSGGGTIGSDAVINMTANNVSTGGALNAAIDNSSGGTIGGSANIILNLAGDLTTHDAFIVISNFDGGTIGSDAAVTLSANDISSISSGGASVAEIANYGGGTIGGNATINVTAANITASSLFAQINNSNGGSIGSGANVTLNVGGDLTTQSDAAFQILNYDLGSGPGTIGSDAVINVTARNVSTGGLLNAAIDNSSGGTIGGSANLAFNLSGQLATQSDTSFTIDNTNGGMIGADAAVNVSAANMSTPGFLYDAIDNSSGGSITGSANVTFSLTGDLNTQGAAVFEIFDFGDGTIGSDATINVSAANISTQDELFSDIDDRSIGGNAIINFSLTGDLNTQGDAQFQIADGIAGGTIGLNATINVSAVNISTGGELFSGIYNTSGNIGGNAAINVNAANITANSLTAQIDNTDGSIGGNATINMHVSGTATVTNDATVAIFGSDGAASSAINIEGGNYNVGGTFLSYIDGNGTMTFNNASAHADVIKAGVFGANGVLNVGGGILSADTELKLYAPGSNGQLNFVSNVTLGGNSLKILAADSVAIFNNVVVTIGGPNPADVYTNHANYTGFGGNGTTTGTFAGAGANGPEPLSNAPPFGPSSPATSKKRIPVGINISNTDELLALLDAAAAGPGRKITIPRSKSKRNWRNSSRFNAAGRLNAERRAMAIRTAD